MIVSHIIILFVTFGHLTIDKTVEFLETSIDGCTNETFSSQIIKPTSSMLLKLSEQKPIEVSRYFEKQDMTMSTLITQSDYSQFPQNIFTISYMYYSLFGTTITVLVGIIVSLLTRSESDAYDSKYIHPVVYRMAKWFPGSEKLFTNDQTEATDIRTSSLKEPIEQHYNSAFDIKSEEILSGAQAFNENETNSVKFKSNLVFTSEKIMVPVENYKKLSED
jgi:solute carrier family 5 (sodium-coupled monocarboxylate transporter), member 8/12